MDNKEEEEMHVLESRKSTYLHVYFENIVF